MNKKGESNRHKEGLSIKNPEAHQKDHQHWTRRNFMQAMGLTTSVGLTLGQWPLQAFTSRVADYVGETDRVLVLVRLIGGNDGLNTVVPLFDYSKYAGWRPGIAHPAQSLYELPAGLALPGQAEGLHALWEKDQMKIVQGVGYPEQNLSHFRSSDIWDTASDSSDEIDLGWLGRLLMVDNPNIEVEPPEQPAAIQIGNSNSLTFHSGDNNTLSFSVSNTQQLFQLAENGQFYPTDFLGDCLHEQQEKYLREVTNSTFRYADVIQQAYEGSSNALEYTNSGLADQLAIVARLIKGGLQTSFYMVTLNGFDTHAGQKQNHDRLIQQLGANMDEFYQDLSATNDDDRVLGMSISEFGRRPQQNASQGTDHGAAAPLFLFGPAVNGSGIVGEHPDLDDLDAADNLKFTTDFRQVYQSVLTDWLCFPSSVGEDVLFDEFSNLDLGLECQTVRASDPIDFSANITKMRMGLRHHRFEVQSSRAVKGHVEVYSMSGQVAARLYRGQFHPGSQTFDVFADQHGMRPGLYVLVVQLGRRVLREKFVVAG